MWFYFIRPNHPHQALQSNMYDSSGRPEGSLQHYYCTDMNPVLCGFAIQIFMKRYKHLTYVTAMGGELKVFSCIQISYMFKLSWRSHTGKWRQWPSLWKGYFLSTQTGCVYVPVENKQCNCTLWWFIPYICDPGFFWRKPLFESKVLDITLYVYTKREPFPSFQNSLTSITLWHAQESNLLIEWNGFSAVLVIAILLSW